MLLPGCVQSGDSREPPRAQTVLRETKQVSSNGAEIASFAGCRINGESCAPVMLTARGSITSTLPAPVPWGLLAAGGVPLRHTPVGDGSAPLQTRYLKHSPHSGFNRPLIIYSEQNAIDLANPAGTGTATAPHRRLLCHC